jgi:hypothetical protein
MANKISIKNMNRLLILLSITFASCGQGVQFNIHNTTADTIDFIEIKTSDFTSQIKLNNIPPGKSQSIYLDMNKVKNIDGHFKLNSSSRDVGKFVDFGYYSNGVPQNDTIDVFINNLNINFDLK